jgi:hypothetical protein
MEEAVSRERAIFLALQELSGRDFAAATKDEILAAFDPDKFSNAEVLAFIAKNYGKTIHPDVFPSLKRFLLMRLATGKYNFVTEADSSDTIDCE